MVFEWEMTLDNKEEATQDIYDEVEKLIISKNYSESLKAIQIMKEGHKNQRRKGPAKVPYIVHVLTVARQAFELQIDTDDIVASCLLHDVVEDCGKTSDQFDVNDKIRKAVDLVSFFESSTLTHEQAKAEYFKQISNNEIAMVVKVLDRCNNLSCMAGAFSREKMMSYIEETEKYILPLLDKLTEEYEGYEHARFCLNYHMKSLITAIKSIM